MTEKNRQNAVQSAESHLTAPSQKTGRFTLRNAVFFCLGMTAAAGLGFTARFPTAVAQEKPKAAPEGYAQAYLQLAQAQLAYAEQMNQKSRGSFSETQVNQFRKSVEIAQNMIQQEKKSGRFDRMTAMIHWAQHNKTQAETDVALAETLNRKLPGSVEKARIQELQAYAELAELDAKAGEALSNASPEKQLEWRVTVLEDELLRLRKEVSLLRQLEQ